MTRLVLAFDYEMRSEKNYWRSDEWRAAEQARAASGSTSIRLSKATSEALTALATRLVETIPAGEKFRYPQRVTHDELIAALAAGVLALPAAAYALLAAEITTASMQDVDVHASHDRTVHANGAAADPACKQIPAHAKNGSGKVHAKRHVPKAKSHRRTPRKKL